MAGDAPSGTNASLGATAAAARQEKLAAAAAKEAAERAEQAVLEKLDERRLSLLDIGLDQMSAAGLPLVGANGFPRAPLAAWLLALLGTAPASPAADSFCYFQPRNPPPRPAAAPDRAAAAPPRLQAPARS